MTTVKIILSLVVMMAITTSVTAQDSDVLQRSLDELAVSDEILTSESVHYTPVFGTGDEDESVPKGLERYGHLSIEGQGSSEFLNFGRMELVYYVLEGTGLLNYSDQQIPISRNDFFYIPIDTQHSFENPRELPLNMIMMSFPVPDAVVVNPTQNLMLASADEVDFQILEQNNHGPTSSFQLLMGTTNSRRDRLAAAYQMNSLYVIDFEPGGTNIPHRHPNEEEIYFVLQGHGDMVAGETSDGEEMRYAAEPGDVFFFGRNSLVGFYNQADTPEHARILAVRHKYPE